MKNKEHNLKVNGQKFTWWIVSTLPYISDNWDPYHCQLTIKSEAGAILIVPFLKSKNLTKQQREHPDQAPSHEATIWKSDVEKCILLATEKQKWNMNDPQEVDELWDVDLTDYRN
jgi:hypothetical protein